MWETTTWERATWDDTIH